MYKYLYNHLHNLSMHTKWKLYIHVHVYLTCTCIVHLVYSTRCSWNHVCLPQLHFRLMTTITWQCVYTSIRSYDSADCLALSHTCKMDKTTLFSHYQSVTCFYTLASPYHTHTCTYHGLIASLLPLPWSLVTSLRDVFGYIVLTVSCLRDILVVGSHPYNKCAAHAHIHCNKWASLCVGTTQLAAVVGFKMTDELSLQQLDCKVKK